MREVLGDYAQADAFMAAYGVTQYSNASTGSAHGFEGKNILEFVGDIEQRPALTEALSQPREVAIVGDPGAAATQALMNVVRDGYRPSQVVALGAPGTRSPAVPLLQDRGLMNGQATAYVCRGFVCQAPVEELEGLLAQLDRR